MTAGVQLAVSHRRSGGGALRLGCPYLFGTVHKEVGRSETQVWEALWTEFSKRIEPARQDLPDGLADVSRPQRYRGLIRMTRSEVGHPAGRQIDEDPARAHLAIALIYLCKMKQLANHFAAETGGVKA